MDLPLCVKVNRDDEASFDSLIDSGWRFVGNLITYRGCMPVAERDRGLRQVVDPLKRPLDLARNITWTGRLYRDQSLWDTELAWCNTVKTIENPSLTCVVIGSAPAAFIIWDRLRVVLVGVHPVARGLGLARKLLCRDNVTITAGTNDKNEAAIGLYKSLGMEKILTQAVFHK